MPAPGSLHWVEMAGKVLNKDQGTKETVQLLLNDTCPQFVGSLLEAGQAELEKQVQLACLRPYSPLRLHLDFYIPGFTSL